MAPGRKQLRDRCRFRFTRVNIRVKRANTPVTKIRGEAGATHSAQETVIRARINESSRIIDTEIRSPPIDAAFEFRVKLQRIGRELNANEMSDNRDADNKFACEYFELIAYDNLLD